MRVKNKVHRNQAWHCPHFFFLGGGANFKNGGPENFSFFWDRLGEIKMCWFWSLFLKQKNLFATSSYVYNIILLFNKHNLLVTFSFHDCSFYVTPNS